MAQSEPPVHIPRLIRDTLYAPECPNERIAALLDVALTHHNCGRYAKAVEVYNAARTAWEDALLQVMIDDAKLTELAAECAAKPWILTGEPDPTAPAKPTPTPGAEDGDGDADGSDGDAEADEAERLKAELAARDRQRNVDRLNDICAERATVVPAEARVFIHLALGAVYSSAQQDADALAEYGAARRVLVTSVLVHSTTLTATFVNAALGAVNYHLSQLDYAGDYFFRCLEAREALCGDKHVDTAAAMNNVGAVLFLLGRRADSLLLFNKALAIVKDQLPASSPRRDTLEINVRIAKGEFFTDATFPAVPFTPQVVPMIPGAKRAFIARQPKPKKAPADTKGKGKK